MLRIIAVVLLVVWIVGLVLKLAAELIWGALILAVLLGVLDFILKRQKTSA